MIKEKRSCPICNEQKGKLITSLDYAMWDDLNIDGYADLMSCQSCGMVYHQTSASEADFKRYYASHDYYAKAETMGSGGLSEGESARYQRIYSSLEPFVNKQQPVVVDIGSGKGGFLSWCQQQGLKKLIAVEKSLACGEVIRKNLKLPVYDDVASLATDTPKIDVVILSHVLEHAFHPVELLSALLELADDNTLFYIEVPNAASYSNETNPWPFLYFEHINHFDDLHLQMLLESLGLNLLSQSKGAFVPQSGKADECCMTVSKKSKKNNIKLEIALTNLMQTQLSYFPDILTTIENSFESKDVSIWGVSQYTQFIIAKSPTLQRRLRFLFDKSPAKCGRYIRGHLVESPENLGLLNRNDVLLVPNNIYSSAMVKGIQQSGFFGQLILF
jgi:hypothetical protein